MFRIGYLYSPAILADPVEEERSRLVAAGAQDVYIDSRDRSGYATLVEQWQAQLEGQLGQSGKLLLVRLSDLGNSATEIQQQWQLWQERGIAIHLVTPNGIEALCDSEVRSHWWAQLPQQLKRRQIALGHAHSRLDRKPPPGRAPFGYRRQGNAYTLHKPEAALVRAFFDYFLICGSLRGAVAHVSQIGSNPDFGKSSSAKPISVSMGRRWLTNAVYRGDLAFKDGNVLRDTHAAILSREEAAQIDRWLHRNRTIARRSASAPRSLAGLTFCRTCGQQLRTLQASRADRSTRYSYLRCDRCSYSLNYDRILAQVIATVCQQLPSRTAAFDAAPIQVAKQNITLQIAANNTKIHELMRGQRLDRSENSIERWERYCLESANASLQASLERLPPENLAAIAKAVSIETFWFDLTETERRFYLREFIEKVWVTRSGDLDLEFFVRSEF